MAKGAKPLLTKPASGDRARRIRRLSLVGVPPVRLPPPPTAYARAGLANRTQLLFDTSFDKNASLGKGTIITMKRLIDIDLLNDEALQTDMATGSLCIVLVGTLLGVLGVVAFPHESVSLLWFTVLGFVSVAALPVHELVHAAAFKLLSRGRARIVFGFSNWMLYTAAPGCVLSRGRFCAVLLAPAVVVTGALGIGAAALGWPLLGWFLAVLHLAGCTGDIGYVRIIAGEPLADLVEDTERGITLFRNE